uniref:Uncharacterized protein n=1 Tax=Arundo donax TaxID=35708 RepID=A0A0A9EZT4_ARUDO
MMDTGIRIRFQIGHRCAYKEQETELFIRFIYKIEITNKTSGASPSPSWNVFLEQSP